MPLEKHVVPRWVVQKVDGYSVRCAKELAIRYDVRIAEVVEIAIYRLYAHQAPLESFVARRSSSAGSGVSTWAASRDASVESPNAR